MHRGKYQGTRGKIRNKKKPFILIASLVLLLAAAVGGTVAFLWVNSGQVTNTFTPGEVMITINEEKTSTSKSNISFTNPVKDDKGNPLNTVPVYVRATLVIYWTDTFDLTDDGVDNPTEQTIPKPADAAIEGGNVLGEGWFEVGDIYYYAAPVAPDSSTTVMLDAITVTVPDGSGAQCHIDIHAEAIQAEPQSAVGQAWTDVEVEDGRLKAK